jgi:hypothetical protein
MENNINIFLPNNIPDIANNLLTGKFIADGEPITAAVTNRIPQVNNANAQYIYSLLQKAYNSAGEFLRNQPIADDVQVGHFVYYCNKTKVFQRALAKYILQTGRVKEAPTAAVWGLVTNISYNKADICISGLCTLTPTIDYYKNLDDVGELYLSDTIPGEPTIDIKYPYKCLGSLIGVRTSGEIQFFVRLNLASDPRLHEHRSYELAAKPAGSWQLADNMITNANLGIAGWLPAAHAVFNNKAPHDAIYGYNPNFLGECKWPLLFAAAAGLRWQRKSTLTDDPILATVPPEFYRIDDTTIWWLQETVPYLPWDSSLDYIDGESLLPDGGDAAYVTYEDNDAYSNPVIPQYTQRIWLETINMGYGLTDRIVTTLRSIENSGLYVRQYPYGGPATAGDLEIGFTPPFTSAPNVLFTESAAADIDTEWNIQRTAVVSGLKIDSTRLKVIQSDQKTENYHHGKVVLGDPTGNIGKELSFEAIHLNGVEEAVEREAVGLAFPSSRVTSLLARVTLPFDTTFDQFYVTLLFGILLPRTGTIAEDIFKLSYRIITNPITADNANQYNTPVQAFPDPQLQLLDCDFHASSNVYLSAYYTAESAKLVAKPGDILLIKMERTPPDNFLDRIIVLRKSALLYAS